MLSPRRPLDLTIGLLIVFLVAPAAVGAQTASNPAVTDPLAGLSVGQWIRLQGTLRGSTSVTCTNVRQLAGDFLDDDWSLKGTVRSTDAAKQEFAIAGCRVSVTGNTTYGRSKGEFGGFPDLKVGMLLEIEGGFLQRGVLLAAEVDDESDELVRRPELKHQIEVVGKIDRLDARRRVLTVMGIDFHVTEKTRLRTVIK